MRIQDLWTWQGSIGRGRYLAWGSLLMAIKFGIDWSVSWLAFDRGFGPYRYLFPGENLRMLETQDRLWFLTLLVISLPFLYTGTALTMRRLRSFGLVADVCVAVHGAFAQPGPVPAAGDSAAPA